MILYYTSYHATQIASGFPEVSSILVINTDAYQVLQLAILCISYKILCGNGLLFCFVQSSNFRLAKNINCPVTIIDFFSEPICEDFGQANAFCEQSKLQ